MMSVSKEMIEAARLEGASDWVILRKIIIPQTSSSAIYVFVITVVFGLQYVMIPVNILTQGGPNQAVQTSYTLFTNMLSYSIKSQIGGVCCVNDVIIRYICLVA